MQLIQGMSDERKKGGEVGEGSSQVLSKARGWWWVDD